MDMFLRRKLPPNRRTQPPDRRDLPFANIQRALDDGLTQRQAAEAFETTRANIRRILREYRHG